MGSELAIGFDIGGSTVRAGLIRFSGDTYEVLEQRKENFGGDDKAPHQLAQRIASMAAQLRVPDYCEPPIPCGIGLCAQLTAGGEHVVNSPNLHWRDVPFGSLIREVVKHATIRITNDLNAILVGENAFGAARGFNDVVAIYPGTGIGGALLVDGSLIEGAHGFAGEIGHVKVGSGISCGCGGVGCLETVAGGYYIERRIASDRQDGRLDRAYYDPDQPIRVDAIDRAYADGEPYARELWAEVTDALATAAAVLVGFLNPEMILLGGGVLDHCPNLLEKLRTAIPARSPGVCGDGLTVNLGELGWLGGVLGAAQYACRSRSTA